MHRAQVSIVCDSISYEGVRLTTFQLRYWRPIHAELMTHRVFSRNAGSSRARPSAAIIEQVMTDPWGPLHWGQNQPGMQAETELGESAIEHAKWMWKNAAQAAGAYAQGMVKLGVHKQVVNRLLEPFTYIDVLVTSTQFANWFALRNHKDAQPEIKDLAEQMLACYEKSQPITLDLNEWHLPYISAEDRDEVYWFLKKNRITRDEPTITELNEFLCKISTARCARISYALFDGSKTTIEKDLDLYQKLIVSTPLHASPAEHQATPDTKTYTTVYKEFDKSLQCVFNDLAWDTQEMHGNLAGWIQYRKTLPNEFVQG